MPPAPVPLTSSRRWMAVLLPVVLVGLALYARSLAAQAFTAFTHYDTPFATEPGSGVPAQAAPAVPQPAVPALTEQVVLVLLDGLGEAPSRRLPFLNELRARGADFALRIGLPSLSLPGRGVLMSGAWQEVHGQATNQNPRPLRVEHLFELARRAGRETALAGGKTAQRLFVPYVSDIVLYAEAPETAPFATYEEWHRRQVAAAVALLRTRHPAFAVIELYVTDEAGHGWGAGSAEYQRAGLDADAALREMAPLLDLSRTTLVVTADHGHVAKGGHGGPEEDVMTVPFVLAGRGVRAGVQGAGTQADAASTVCALLGLPIPSSNQGRPLLDALALAADQRVGLLRATLDARRAFLTRYTLRLRALDGDEMAEAPGAVAAPPDGGAGGEPEVVAALDAVDAALASVKQRRLALEATVRSRRSLLFVVLPFLACGLAFVGGPFGRRDLAVAAAAAAGGVLLYYALLPAFGLHYSLTAVNKDEWLAPFFRKDMLLGVATCALAALAAALVRTRRPGDGGDAAAAAWLASAVYVYLFVVKVAFVYWRHGVILRWSMPEQYWSFGFYLDALVVMAVGFASPFLGALGWAAQRAVRGRGRAASL